MRFLRSAHSLTHSLKHTPAMEEEEEEEENQLAWPLTNIYAINFTLKEFGRFDHPPSIFTTRNITLALGKPKLNTFSNK